jgi:hypothetical protein
MADQNLGGRAGTATANRAFGLGANDAFRKGREVLVRIQATVDF